MIKATVLFLIFSMLSLPAIADTYLCIAEKAAGVSSKDGAVLDADAGRNDSKYIVSESGLKHFGNEEALLDKCNVVDGRPVWCETNRFWGGVFRMSPHHLFTLIYGVEDEGKETDFIVKGKCSKISD